MSDTEMLWPMPIVPVEHEGSRVVPWIFGVAFSKEFEILSINPAHCNLSSLVHAMLVLPHLSIAIPSMIFRDGPMRLVIAFTVHMRSLKHLQRIAKIPC